jgi:hypothetical protein
MLATLDKNIYRTDMPKPVPDAPARYRAFLRALRRTANAELAFRQSGVNRSWAYWRRKRDADFARDWAAALAAGRERLGIRPPVKPSWDGVPLVLTGRFTSKHRRLRRAMPTDFTDDRKRVFLRMLRATCNVAASARAAGVEPNTARRHRAMGGVFAAAYDDALAQGRLMLEHELIYACLQKYDPDPDDRGPEFTTGDVAGMDWSVAFQTLRLHLPERRARWKVKRTPALPSIEEVNAEVAQIVKAMRAGKPRGRGTKRL